MDPFTIALATFGVQKLEEIYKRALEILIVGGSYALGPSGRDFKM